MNVKHLVFCLLAFASTSCSNNDVDQQPANELPQLFTHTISQSGETLGAIAKWYTGSSSNWSAIQDANPSLDPKRIKIGMTVLIPQNLVVRTNPLPRHSVASTKPTAAMAALKELPVEVPADSASTADSFSINQPLIPNTEKAQDNSAAVVTGPPATDNLPTTLVPPSESGVALQELPPGNLTEKVDLPVAAEPPATNKGVVTGILEAVGKASMQAKSQ